jgi:hypothetical protein
MKPQELWELSKLKICTSWTTLCFRFTSRDRHKPAPDIEDHENFWCSDMWTSALQQESGYFWSE